MPKFDLASVFRGSTETTPTPSYETAFQSGYDAGYTSAIETVERIFSKKNLLPPEAQRILSYLKEANAETSSLLS